MAKRKPAKKRPARSTRRGRRPAPARTGARKRARKAGARAPRRAKPARKAPRVKARPAQKTAKRVKTGKRVKTARRVKKASVVKKATARTATVPRPRPAAPPAPKSAHITRPPVLERERRRLSDVERSESATMTDDRLISAARTGHHELAAELERHTEASPVLTAGDIDARWQDAYAVGDEAPGGDNPTPGQDRVDAIGRALGINYRDDEELRGGDEVVERDRHRWELDPASSDDWPEGHEK